MSDEGDSRPVEDDAESDADAGLGPDFDDAESAGGDGQSGAEDGEFPANPERVAFLREIADDVRGESGESRQLAAILYRVSDLYDPEEETSPVEIYRNVEHIMEIKAQGGIDR